MKFDELDQRMRVFETSHDHCALPGIYLVARLDGRNFTRLTKERLDLEAPFDERFRDAMVETVAHLMESGFRVAYGYTQSDEISLLFDADEDAFGRKLRKFNSILAGEASAKFSLLMGTCVSFDCRVCQFPRWRDVQDYFSWRSEDAHRNALNAHCYWHLRHKGENATNATRMLVGMSVAGKNELLFQSGINFNDLPTWQKRGVGLYWESYEKDGLNPVTGETTKAIRRRIVRDLEIPMKEDYRQFIERRISDAVPTNE
ncbi:MAG TPA: tRNA(His) guanylyltransferase Thg1 family protein [Phycisphaerae bacterium]|nr:tRNA(His) guanylyltransferase Thg1 family protein [Phycisphaerae bacterium]